MYVCHDEIAMVLQYLVCIDYVMVLRVDDTTISTRTAGALSQD